MTLAGETAEAARLRAVYRARDAAMPQRDWRANVYHPRHSLGHLFHEHHHDALVRALNALELELEGRRILDVGCGHGAWLRYLVELGAAPSRLCGVDLSEARIRTARAANPAIRWLVGGSAGLPFASGSFDWVMQAVVFSSILDEAARRTLAAEMARVTRPGGLLLWVDHRRSFPPRLAGFSQEQVRAYFPSAEVVYADAVHPRYFRRLHRHAWLARLLYGASRAGCDSWLLLLRLP